MSKYPNLFKPLKVGSMELKNRVIFGPHATNHWPNHLPDERTVAYYEERAKGGVGMIVIGGSQPDSRADYAPIRQPAMWSDTVIPGMRAIADAVHAHGAKLLIQLLHPGSQHNPDRNPEHHPGVSPTQLAAVFPPAYGTRELDTDGIREIEDLFAAAALRAKQAGLDGVELQGAHGYLIGQFLSAIDNQRTDAYGGQRVEERFRFLGEIISKVRAKVGPDFVLGVRISANEHLMTGLLPEHMAKVAALIEQTGKVDYISVSSGVYRSAPHIIPSHQLKLGPAYNAADTAEIKAAVTLPVFLVGQLFEPARMEKLLAKGVADAAVVVRQLMADADFVKKAMAGEEEDMRPCVYWNQGCVARMLQGHPIECHVNAAAGHELEYGAATLAHSGPKKRVLVIGAGPAGLEFARVAAIRGHEVVIYERDAEVGGQVRQFARLPGRAEVSKWVSWAWRQLLKTGRVELMRGIEITPANVADLMRRERPDEIVVATGAKPAHDGRSSVTAFPIPGHEQPHVFTYAHVLSGAVPQLGKNVLIVDDLGDRIAPGIAELLATKGHSVEVLTRWPSLGAVWLIHWLEMPDVYKKMDELEVKVTPNSWVANIDTSSVTAMNVYSERFFEVAADSVILSTMRYSESSLVGFLRARTTARIHVIGDAVAPRFVGDALREANRAAYDVSANTGADLETSREHASGDAAPLDRLGVSATAPATSRDLLPQIVNRAGKLANRLRG